MEGWLTQVYEPSRVGIILNPLYTTIGHQKWEDQQTTGTYSGGTDRLLIPSFLVALLSIGTVHGGFLQARPAANRV